MIMTTIHLTLSSQLMTRFSSFITDIQGRDGGNIGCLLLPKEAGASEDLKVHGEFVISFLLSVYSLFIQKANFSSAGADSIGLHSSKAFKISVDSSYQTTSGELAKP